MCTYRARRPSSSRTLELFLFSPNLWIKKTKKWLKPINLWFFRNSLILQAPLRSLTHRDLKSAVRSPWHIFLVSKIQWILIYANLCRFRDTLYFRARSQKLTHKHKTPPIVTFLIFPAFRQHLIMKIHACKICDTLQCHSARFLCPPRFGDRTLFQSILMTLNIATFKSESAVKCRYLGQEGLNIMKKIKWQLQVV